MKIFFRYLFVRLLVPFTFIFLSCAVIWIMIDLYGNVDDFIGHKIKVHTILYFYLLQIPNMIVPVLPATLLFSVLWTLLSLNRRSELVAFQSGGMAPWILFSPFFLFTVIWVAILAYDLNSPAAEATVARERVLQQIKGQNASRNVFLNLPYVDTVNRRVWFFQSLDTNRGEATGVEILQRDAQGRDMQKFFASHAQWNNGLWRLTGVREFIFGPDGSVQEQKTFEVKELDITTPPRQLSLIVSQPEQLTFSQLAMYIRTSTATQAHLAGYRTEWWYRIIHPFSLVVLLLFALSHGLRTDRRSAVAGVVGAILILIAYILFMSVFMTAGRYSHLPPFVAVVATPLIFGLYGLHRLAVANGWWWQVWEAWQRRQAKS